MSSGNIQKKFEQSNEFHGPISPADIRIGDPVTAECKVVENNLDFKARVWRLSPLGVEIIKPSDVTLARGTVIDLILKIGTQTTDHRGLVVDTVLKEKGNDIVPLRLVMPTSTARLNVDRR